MSEVDIDEYGERKSSVFRLNYCLIKCIRKERFPYVDYCLYYFGILTILAHVSIDVLRMDQIHLTIFENRLLYPSITKFVSLLGQLINDFT